MYFVLSDRNGLIRPVPKNAVWAEVGVYKGDFSQIVLDTCGPSRYYLIDNWKFDPDEHNPFQDTTENFSNGDKAAAGFAPENSGQYFVSVDSVEDQEGTFCLVYSYK